MTSANIIIALGFTLAFAALVAAMADGMEPPGDCAYVRVVDCACDANPCECRPTARVVFVCGLP